jgi:hypothetical protein
MASDPKSEDGVNIVKIDDIKIDDINYLKVNLDPIIKLNKDTKGWLYFPGPPAVTGLPIDISIVQAKNNDYYLSHSFDKTYNVDGWVFADSEVDMDNITGNYNTVIYGHARSYEMFGGLKEGASLVVGSSSAPSSGSGYGSGFPFAPHAPVVARALWLVSFSRQSRDPLETYRQPEQVSRTALSGSLLFSAADHFGSSRVFTGFVAGEICTIPGNERLSDAGVGVFHQHGNSLSRHLHSEFSGSHFWQTPLCHSGQ